MYTVKDNILGKESLLAARNKSAKELPKNWAKVRM